MKIKLEIFNLAE